jgi:hypothetical protein
VTEKERLLDLLAEKRRAPITRAVTRGVDGAKLWSAPAERSGDGALTESDTADPAGALRLAKAASQSPRSKKFRDSGLPWLGEIPAQLKHYTTYATYFKLLRTSADDPNVKRKKAAKALARFLRLHPYNIAQKTEVMVEHFNAVTRHKIGGKAKAMVVTGSRLEAVRYKESFDRYIKERVPDQDASGVFRNYH